MQGHFFQGLSVHRCTQVTDRRLNSILGGPEGQVQVGACQGHIQGPTGVLQDRRQEPEAMGELPAVLQELVDPLVRFDLDADACRRPSAVTRVLEERLQDPMVDVLHSRMSSKAFERGHQDQVRVVLIGLCEQDLFCQGLLRLLGQHE